MNKRSIRFCALLTLGAMLPGLTGCETMQQNTTATGGVIGALVGAGAGALIDKNNPGRGALIGAAVGGAVGAGIGYLAREKFRNAQSGEVSRGTVNQRRANEIYLDSNPQRPLPPVAKPVLNNSASYATPQAVRPGETVAFKMAVEAPGQTPYTGNLCREDRLYVYEAPQGGGPAQLVEVSDLGEKCQFPAGGNGEHSTTLTIPPGAPAGRYLLKSAVHDNVHGALFNKDYEFTVAAP